MYTGHSWAHHRVQRDFTNSSDMESLPTPAMFGDDTGKDKTTVINNGNTGGGPTTIGFHMETMVMTFLMVLGLCLIAALLYAYQKIKSLKKKLKILKEDLQHATGSGRDRRRRNNSN